MSTANSLCWNWYYLLYDMITLLQDLFMYDDTEEENCTLNKISLNMAINPKGCAKFIKKAGDYKLNKLSWFGFIAMSAIEDESIFDYERFAFNTLPNSINTVYLIGWTDVERFCLFLKIVLKKAKENVTFGNIFLILI